MADESKVEQARGAVDALREKLEKLGLDPESLRAAAHPLEKGIALLEREKASPYGPLTAEEAERVRVDLATILAQALRPDSLLSFDASRALEALLQWETYPERKADCEEIVKVRRLNARQLDADLRARTYWLANTRRDAWRWYAGHTGSPGQADHLMLEEEKRFGPIPEAL